MQQLLSTTALETVLEQPARFFYLVFTLTYLFTVSSARIAEAKGYYLPNLAARQTVSRLLATGLLFILWAALTFVTYRAGNFLVLLALFGQPSKILLLLLLIISIYIGLTVLFIKWNKGGTVSAGIMATIISIIFLYTITFKPGWMCRPMALSGFSSTYACLARAYEYPGNKGLRADAQQMRYWYERAAQAGDSEVAYLIALRTKDESKKSKFFAQAATAGHVKAAHQYSRLQSDKNESIKWLRIAADGDVPDAIFELGNRHYSGIGVKKDFNKTRQLWLQAAEAGSILAMLQIASSYQSNNVIFDKNIEKYTYWKQKALNEKERRLAKKNIYSTVTLQEDPFNLYISTRFESMLDHLDVQEKYLTQKVENDHDFLKKQAKLYLQYQDGDVSLREKAITIYARLAKTGDIDSQFELAMLLLTSKQPIGEDLEEGRRWLMASANTDHERAVQEISEAYEKGIYGFPKDLVKSLHYSEKRRALLAKRPNSSVNRTSRQFAYYRSQNIEAQLNEDERLKTIKMLRKPAQEGDANAQYRLADLLMAEHKRAESFSWLAKAAKNGNPDAQYLESKRIVFMKPRDKFANLSFTYLKEAAQKNHPGAMIMLAAYYYGGFKTISLKRNLHQAYLLYNKVLNSTNKDILFVNKFGNPKITSPITRDYVVAKLNEIPESIKRMKLHDLTTAQKKIYVNQWYLKEMENLDQKENPQEYLEIINDQRDALLSPTR